MVFHKRYPPQQKKLLGLFDSRKYIVDYVPEGEKVAVYGTENSMGYACLISLFYSENGRDVRGTFRYPDDGLRPEYVLHRYVIGVCGTSEYMQLNRILKIAERAKKRGLIKDFRLAIMEEPFRLLDIDEAKERISPKNSK